MITVGLRRTRTKGAACAAVAAFACLGAIPAFAEVANPNYVPAESAYIISMPNTPALWTAWEGNGLYQAYKKVMAMPEVKEKSADFEKQISIVESSLGFKLDGPTLSSILTAGDIYVQQASSDKEMNGVGIFKVADAEKLTKLMDLAEKAAAKSAESDDDDDATTATSASDSATSVVTETDYQGVKIRTFKSKDGEKNAFRYARPADLLVVSNDDAAIKKALDRVKATTPAADTIGASDKFKKIDASLASQKGELYVYGNQELASTLNNSDQVPAGVIKPLQSLMNDLAPVGYYGASVKINPKEIFSYSYGLLKEGSSESLALKNPGTAPLEVASYVPETTLMAFATSLVNAPAIAEVVSGVAGSSDDGEKMSKQVKQAEMGLGFSVKNDLVPALGNEVAFSLSKIEFGGLIPTVDATLAFSVKDKAKMTKVVEGVERMATNAMAAKSDDSDTSAPAFQKETVDGQTVKYTEMQGLAGLSPGYVLTDNYLIIGSTKGALTSALNAHSGGKSLARGTTLTSLGHDVSANANIIQYVNLAKILDVGKQVSNAFPAAKPFVKYIDTASVLDSSASVSRVEDGAQIGRGVLKLK